MGLVKSEWIESQARGWDPPEKYVCAHCVEDDYLKSVIDSCASEKHCDYCGRKSRFAIGAPVAAILEPIAYALFSHFAEPGEAGLPRDSGEWVGEEHITDTSDALLSLPLNCTADLFEDIATSFHNTAWYPCAGGSWLDIHEHEELGYAWNSFVYEIKHRSRYFLLDESARAGSAPGERYTAMTLLHRIGNLVQEMHLVRTLPAGTTMYRVRRATEGVEFSEFDEVGPPPEDQAGAGRMNPPGISYFYMALEKETALAEVLEKPPCRAAIAEFETKCDFTLLDLTELPMLPSIFDSDHREEREGLIFLGDFVDAIGMPVIKDGREHVEYIPSQVVCEFLAQRFQIDRDGTLNGIVYPSAVRPGGKNIVLFPRRYFGEQWNTRVKLHAISHVSLFNWEDIKKSI